MILLDKFPKNHTQQLTEKDIFKNLYKSTYVKEIEFVMRTTKNSIQIVFLLSNIREKLTPIAHIYVQKVEDRENVIFYESSIILIQKQP